MLQFNTKFSKFQLLDQNISRKHLKFRIHPLD